MRRYWPLTAVLLAFWLGRETGAEDAQKVTKFDRILAREITLIGDTSVALLKGDSINLVQRNLVTSLAPGSVHVLEKGKNAEDVVRTAGLVASDDAATVSVVDRRSGFEASLWADHDQSSVAVADYKGREAKTDLREIELSLSAKACAVSVKDRTGRPRAALGTTVISDKKTENSTRFPESTLTLYDARGTVLAQLPR
ncbi:MAG: hypothetical protein ACYTEG_10250 [Planctomycetota bacterium]